MAKKQDTPQVIPATEPTPEPVKITGKFSPVPKGWDPSTPRYKALFINQKTGDVRMGFQTYVLKGNAETTVYGAGWELLTVVDLVPMLAELL